VEWRSSSAFNRRRCLGAQRVPLLRLSRTWRPLPPLRFPPKRGFPPFMFAFSSASFREKRLLTLWRPHFIQRSLLFLPSGAECFGSPSPPPKPVKNVLIRLTTPQRIPSGDKSMDCFFPLLVGAFCGNIQHSCAACFFTRSFLAPLYRLVITFLAAFLLSSDSSSPLKAILSFRRATNYPFPRKSFSWCRPASLSFLFGVRGNPLFSFPPLLPLPAPSPHI